MEFESSPGGWDDVSSSDFEEAYSVEEHAPRYSEDESEDHPSFSQPQRQHASAPRQAQAGQPHRVNPLSGASFLDRLPPRGPIDAAVSNWIDEQFGGHLTVPFKKIGKADGSWLFGLRRIRIKIGTKTGQPYVDLASNSMLLIDFWGRFEYVEQRKIDGAAAGTQAMMTLLQQLQN